MRKEAVFYHAGCAVCVDAEQKMLELLDKKAVDLEIVHFGEAKDRIVEAEKAGVKSVPALCIGDDVLHINFGASMDDVKQLLDAGA